MGPFSLTLTLYLAERHAVKLVAKVFGEKDVEAVLQGLGRSRQSSDYHCSDSGGGRPRSRPGYEDGHGR